MLKIVPLFVILLLFSCTNAETNTKENGEAINNTSIKKTQWKDTVNCSGFVGNNPVISQLIFNDSTNEIKGFYQYKSNSKLKFNLKGIAEDWYGGWNYKISEYSLSGEKTGEWSGLRQDIDDAYKAVYSSSDGKFNTAIILLPNESKLYLDTASKAIFKSNDYCKRFFKKNQFLHNEINNKGGMIVSPEPVNYENQIWLPKGINIYEQDGGDFASFEICGKVEQNNVLKFNDGKSLQLSYSMGNFEPVGYEEYRLRFDYLITPEYISIMLNEELTLYINIEELNKKGWFIKGDCKIFKENSGHVLGYYPDWDCSGDEIDYNSTSTIIIYKTKSDKSKKLLDVNDELGHFLVEDVIHYNGEYWAKVKYEYYKEVPCEGTKLNPKPSVNGWIKFYQNGRVCLRHYSKGC